MSNFTNALILIGFGVFWCACLPAFAHDANGFNLDDPYIIPHPAALDTLPVKERFGDFIHDRQDNPFDLRDPDVIKKEVEYDPITERYILTERIGSDYFRAPTYMTFDEYLKWRQEEQERAYFAKLAGLSGGRGFSKRDDPMDRIDVSRTMIDRLFGGSTVDIRPQGTIDIMMGVDYQKIDDNSLLEIQRSSGGFDFDMAIQMSLTGKIGEKLSMDVNYNTESNFDFDRVLKLQYDTDAFTEDEIIKKIEAGNVSLPLRNSLIQGSQNLFGLKTELQFGKLRLTAVASQQKSEQQQLRLEGGAQEQEFEIRADRYDENRNFFLSHYNRETFESSLATIPQINSQFRINKIEVWVTNDRSEIENNRDIVLLSDFGEFEEDKMTTEDPSRFVKSAKTNLDLTGQFELPSNDANFLYRQVTPDRGISTVRSYLTGALGLEQSRDFEKVSARLLNTSEYTFHPELGFVSLNIGIRPNQVVGVAYEYSYNGQIFQVGEFSEEVPQDPEVPTVLFVKMLKSTTPRVDLPIWDLMMKNIYGIGAFQVTDEDFNLDFYYENVNPLDASGLENTDSRNIPNSSIPGSNLIEILNLDNLNSQRDDQPDGRFDFIQGLTINTRNGRIMIPLLEPFGSSLAELLAPEDSIYIFQELYDNTVTAAREFTEKNRFLIKGSHKSSVSKEISLGALNVNPESVKVYAGGTQLVNGSDYEVNASRGTITLLRDDLVSSGVPVTVDYEDQSLFSFQTKTMLGLRADYEFSENFNIGGTYLNLSERPFTQKVNVGDDPINNTVYGLDVNYSTESDLITRLVDKIPLINTKEKSSINISAEFAALRPGHSGAINSDTDQGGSVYIDDFDAAVTETARATGRPSIEWTLASIPTDSSVVGSLRFEESKLFNDLATGVNRAELAWFNAFFNTLNEADRTDPYCRVILERELFPDRAINTAQQNNLNTLTMSFDPTTPGPYNFDVPGGTEYSAGATFVENEVVLEEPKTRWGGIQRNINNPDFEAANIEYLEFWMLNPYIDRPTASSGKLIIQFGNISEDVVKDSRYFYEHGIPGVNDTRRTDNTVYGKVPSRQPINITASFDNDEASRPLQDVGYDGLNSSEEIDHYADYLNAWDVIPIARPFISQDPAHDNFKSLEDYPDNFSCIEKYSKFNSPDGNSPIRSGSNVQIGKITPDVEDIDRNGTVDESESYFSYEIQLVNNNGAIDLTTDAGRITDTINITGRSGPDETWYRYRIPLRQFNQRVGGIQDFRSIRFMRMYMTEFAEPAVLRFAEFQLNRSQWREYRRDFTGSPDGCDAGQAVLQQDAVGIVENSGRTPFNYVLPPGIQREQTISALNNGLENERALSLEVCNIVGSCPAGVFKNTNFDFRLYDSLKMFLHAEAGEDATERLNRGDIEVFLRIGSDLANNYYEYIQPLTFSVHHPDDPERNDPDNVWLAANNIAIDLKKMVRTKRGVGDTYDDDTLRIVGLPNLADAKNIMIGVRQNGDVTLPDDIGCITVWANEMRVTGLDERGGVAALARMDVQLADFGNIAASYNYSTIGYGGIDQPLALRQRENVSGYDFSTNLELGKFLPKKSGVKIPFYFQRSVSTSSPEYDPYDEDVKLDEKVEDNPEKASEIKDRAINYNSITSVNFTNVRKERVGNAKPKPWDIENLAISYSNTKEVEHDPIIELNQVNTRRMGLTYNYSRKAKFIKPFNKLIKNKKYLGWIKEFNFNPLPNTLGFDTELDRRFGEVRYRTIANRQYFNKYYNWDRNYTLNWDFSKSLKLSFNATNRGIIDEPDETELLEQFPASKSDRDRVRSEAIREGLKNFGRTKAYDHRIDLSYNVPLKHFPFLDFTNIRAQYSASYNWDAASLNIERLGNSIQNTQRRQLNADFDIKKLYRKIGYFKRIEAKKKTSRGNKKPRSGSKNDGPRAKKSSSDSKTKDGRKSDRSNKKTLEKDVARDAPQSSGNLDEPTSTSSTENEDDPDDKKAKRSGPREITTFERILVRPLLSIRQVRFTYTRDFRSFVPGFTPETEYLGLGERMSAPGWKFVTGIQPTNKWLLNAANNEQWISDDEELNQQFLLADRENYDLKFSLEPFRDFKLDLTWNKSEQKTNTANFKKFDGVNWDFKNEREVGSYTISYFMANTLFGTDVNELFNEFSDNRIILSNRLADQSEVPLGRHATDTISDGTYYREGYGRLHLDVVVPSFIAAYTGQNASSVGLNLFKLTPKPNWNLRWNGLTKVKFLKNIFSNISISHGYSSTLTVNSYNTNSDFLGETLAFSETNKSLITQNFYTRVDIPDIVIREQFTPLLGINVTTNNGASINFDYKKSRALTLSLRESGEVREAKSTDWSIGFGQTFKNVNIGFLQIKPGKKSRSRKDRSRDQKNKAKDADKDNKKSRKRKDDKPKGSDLNVRLDMSFRDDITITHELDVIGEAIPTRGTKTLQIAPSVDYDINPNLNVRFFFDYRSTKSVINPPAPIINTAAGINLRFKLN